jgi:hypothetical protein
MGSPVAVPQGCTIEVAVFDGAREPLPPAAEVLFTVTDGNQKRIFWDYRPPHLSITGLPFHDNFGDNYTVVASADGYHQAGFTPIQVAPNAPQKVDLMLLGKNASYNFSAATWPNLLSRRPNLARLFAADTASPAAAADRYGELLENRPAVLACLLNVTTAMEQIDLPTGSPLDYFEQLIWDDLKQDRFFGYANVELLDHVRAAALQGLFVPEHGSAVFHPGATASFKQVQFGEANVQLTFHEEDRRTIDGVECMKVEPDIDYYKDPGAHALLEVLPNTISQGLTDPRQVYFLRWIAARRAGIPDFDPLYTIA